MSFPDVPNNQSLRSWQEIAAELSQEHDSDRICELSHELNEAMLAEERRKAQERVKAASGSL